MMIFLNDVLQVEIREIEDIEFKCDKSFILWFFEKQMLVVKFFFILMVEELQFYGLQVLSMILGVFIERFILFYYLKF